MIRNKVHLQIRGFVVVLALMAGMLSVPMHSFAVVPSVPGVLYIKFKIGSAERPQSTEKNFVSPQSAGNSRFGRVLNSLGVTEIDPFNPKSFTDSISVQCGIDRIYVVHYTADVKPIDALGMFMATKEVECGSPRYLFPVDLTPNDPDLSQQYALTNMKLFTAWNTTTGSSSLIIADVDCGTNYNHEDLKANMDNAVGFNFSGIGAINDPMPSSGSAFNHGTRTAGCIAEAGNNALGGAGTAYGCKLMAVRVDNGQVNPNGEPVIAYGYEGIDYALSNLARVVNCSWGGPADPASFAMVETFVQEANAHNALIVASAGNNTLNIDDSVFIPAGVRGVLSVGATQESDAVANFSNFGHTVKVYAPGSNIFTTDFPGNSAYTSGADGTSFSSPLVAGVVALVMTAHPTWPPNIVARQIINTCDNVVNPQDRYHYWGRVNAAAAVATPTLPGLAITGYSVNSKANGSIDTVGRTSSVQISFKNFLGGGSNLSATLLPVKGVTLNQASATIGTLEPGISSTNTFTVTRTELYSSGQIPFTFAITDGANYQDTLQVYIDLKDQNGFQYVDSADIYASSVKQVSPGVAWVSQGFEQEYNSQFGWYSGFEFEDQSSWNSYSAVAKNSEPLWCVEAIDDVTGWFGAALPGGTIDARIFSTPDAGNSWDSVDVSKITSYVNSIHFFDANNGIFLGDSKSSKWGIGVTTDGGTTWKAPGLSVPSLGSEIGWKNSACWIRKNGWFGTNKAEIYKTTDGGKTWQAYTSGIGGTNVVGIGFDDDTLHGIIVTNPETKSPTGTPSGSNGMFGTSDGGQTWHALTIPSAATPYDVKFAPGHDTAFLLTSAGIFRTSNFGNSWTPIGAPTYWWPTNGSLSIASDKNGYEATAVSDYGIVSYDEAAPEHQGGQGVAEIIPAELSLRNSPNPFSSRTVIRFSDSKREHVMLTVYDELGRNVRTLINGIVDPGVHTANFDAGALANGVYEYVLLTESGQYLTQRMVLTK